jgi:hypothetical protein
MELAISIAMIAAQPINPITDMLTTRAAAFEKESEK